MTHPVLPIPDVSSSETAALTQSVGHAIVWSQGLSIVRLAASLIFSVVVVRQLTPDEYGTYAFLMSFAASVSLLGSMGMDGLFGRYASQFQAKGETGSLAALLKGAVTWRVGYLLVVGVGLTFASKPIAAFLGVPTAEPALHWLGVLIVVQNLRYLLGSFNYALLNARYAESAALVSQVLALILSLVFFTWVARSIAAVLVAVTMAESVALFILILPVVRYLRAPAAHLNFLRDKDMRSVAYNYWLADLLTYGLSAPLAVLLIGVLVPDKAQIAYFALGANLLTQISVVAVSNWKNVPLPALTQARITAGEAGFVRGWELFAKVFALALFPVLVFAQVNARLIIQLLYGVDYMESAVVMQIGAAGFMLGLCAGAWSTLGALYSLNAERPLLWVRAGTSVLNIALIVVLAPLIGAIGAALAGAASTTVSNWIEYQLLRRRAPTHIPWTYFLKLLVVTAAAASVGLLLPVTGWLALVLRGGVYVFVCFGLLVLLKPFSQAEIELVGSLNGRLKPVAALMAR